MPYGFQRTQAECTQLFVRAARRTFSEFLQFFCAILAQHLRNLDAERVIFFGSERIVDSVNFSDILQHAHCLLAECTQFFVRAARRNSGNFAFSSREFGACLAQYLRDIDARRVLFRIWTHIRVGQELQ